MNSRTTSTPLGQRTRWWGKAALIGAAFALFGFNANAQAPNTYTFSTGTSGANATLATFVSPTTLVGASSDDGAGALTNIGFTFNYGGTNYTQFGAGVNGCVRLGAVTTTGSAYYTNTLANANAAGPFLMPYWDDLATGIGGSVRSELQGTAPNRRLVIEWFVTVPRNTSGSANARFQCWLDETTNLITFVYGTGMVANTANSGYTIAINAATSLYTNVDATTNTSSTSTFQTGTTAAFATPRYFQFTPPLPCSGTPVVSIPATAGVCSGSATSLTVTGQSGTGLTYAWEESDDNNTGDPWAPTVGGSGSTTATYTTANLTATKYYRCIVTCAGSPGTSNTCTVSIVNCTYDISGPSAATYTSIMPANGGSGTVYPGWQSTTFPGDDELSTTVSLAGTSFVYQGAAVTGFQASSNGFMTFSTAANASSFTNTLTSAAFNRILAPFWDDLVVTGQSAANRDASMRYQISGTLGSGSAVITIEWAGLERFNIAGPNLNFQVKLYEGSNNIEFIYGNFEGFDGTVTSAYSYTTGYNGTNPAGTTAADRFMMQTGVTNHWSTTASNAHVVMPTCFTKFTLTPGTYTGPVSAPTIPAPANDNSGTAQAITPAVAPCTTYCGIYYTSRSATNSGLGQAGCTTTAGNEDDDVWFSFVSNGTSNYLLTLRSSPVYDGVLQLFQGDATTNITCVNATGAGLIESYTTSGLAAGTYYVRVFHNGVGIGGSGQFALCISEVIPPPANDNICGATSLTVNPTCVNTSGSTLSATISPTTPAPTCGTGFTDVWYSFVASTTGDAVTVSSGTGFNAAIAAYSSSDNTCSGTLTQVSCTNATSTGGVETATGPWVIGNTYFIRVYHAGGGVGGTGALNICVTATAPNCVAAPTAPANGGNACANAGAITLSWPAVAGATAYDVYFDAGGVASTLVSPDQAGTTYPVGVLAAGPYAWRVVPKNIIGAATGCADFTFTVTATPAGDTYATAIPVTLSSVGVGTVSGNNQSTNCYTSNVGNTSADVYYSFTTGPCANAGTATVGICTSSYDSFIRIYDATGTTELASDDDDCNTPNAAGSIVLGTEFSLAPSTTYIVIVEGFGANEGTFTLDIYDGSTDGDGDAIADCVDNCPSIANGNPGDACDDGNAFTFNDMLGSGPTCGCAGTPCTQTVTIEFGTDGGGLRWTLRSAINNSLIQSSPGYPAYDVPPASPSYTYTTCLPDGSFYLTVEDQDCDGIVAGGYILRVAGTRVIDNRGNFSTGCSSAIAGNTGVNVPVGNDRLISASCERLDLRRGATANCSDKLTADNTPNGLSATALVYQFWFYDPNGGVSVRYPANAGGPINIAMNTPALNVLLDNKLYNVRVRTQISPGVWRAWGPACRMMINNTLGNCPATKLQDEPDNIHLSCGVTRALGNSSANLIYAKPKTRFNLNCGSVSATKYQFRFRIPSEGVIIVKNGVSSNPWTYLNNTGIVGTPTPANATLQPCKPYEVEVRASFDGGATWCFGGADPYADLTPWGDVCMVFTSGCLNSGGQHMAEEVATGSLRMYPNPNRGDQVLINMENIQEGISTVSVDIYDTFGKRVSARTIAVQDGFVNSVIELNGELAAGMYLVNFTAGDKTVTERLVIQP